MRISVQHAQSPAPQRRCAYCHGDEADTGELSMCTGCNTLIHGDCRAALTKCTTLGCDSGLAKQALGFRFTQQTSNTPATPHDRDGLREAARRVRDMPHVSFRPALARNLRDAAWATHVATDTVEPGCLCPRCRDRHGWSCNCSDCLSRRYAGPLDERGLPPPGWTLGLGPLPGVHTAPAPITNMDAAAVEAAGPELLRPTGPYVMLTPLGDAVARALTEENRPTLPVPSPTVDGPRPISQNQLAGNTAYLNLVSTVNRILREGRDDRDTQGDPRGIYSDTFPTETREPLMDLVFSNLSVPFDYTPWPPTIPTREEARAILERRAAANPELLTPFFDLQRFDRTPEPTRVAQAIKKLHRHLVWTDRKLLLRGLARLTLRLVALIGIVVLVAALFVRVCYPGTT